ncbi:hypothetical protein [Polaribacter sp. Z022]|uniref:hypothetical protein n=1 Tax=Polaribacter sp. Z022 TaxID=2927125 RepID=UPI00202052E2|nr:hypothetical protein [Polaribacter sp. Z022]MCL7755146.1 hypothetical protein [Polaribacter sp. Z022]
MKYLIIYLIILSAFPTCCNDEAVETEKISLSESEIKLIPYSINQSINFKHSNGFIFNFIVTQDTYNWNSDNYCDECCGGEYTSYQERLVSLESEYPEFNISLSLNNLPYFENEEKIMDININRYNSKLKYDDNSKLICENAICHNEIVVNDKTYYNVIESELENNYDTSSSINLFPQIILYNNNFGIIQIKMSNNETYSINH